MLCISLVIEGIEKQGKGFWKFNASLVKDKEYVDLVKRCIEETKVENNSLSDKGLLWDLIKCKLRGLTISYSVMKRKRVYGLEKRLMEEIEEKELLMSNGDIDMFEELEVLKQE